MTMYHLTDNPMILSPLSSHLHCTDTHHHYPYLVLFHIHHPPNPRHADKRDWKSPLHPLYCKDDSLAENQVQKLMCLWAGILGHFAVVFTVEEEVGQLGQLSLRLYMWCSHPFPHLASILPSSWKKKSSLWAGCRYRELKSGDAIFQLPSSWKKKSSLWARNSLRSVHMFYRKMVIIHLISAHASRSGQASNTSSSLPIYVKQIWDLPAEERYPVSHIISLFSLSISCPGNFNSVSVLPLTPQSFMTLRQMFVRWWRCSDTVSDSIISLYISVSLSSTPTLTSPLTCYGIHSGKLT